MPPVLRQAWNLAVSLKDFVMDGLTTVSRNEYEARLQICDSCNHRQDDRCLRCGCHLSVKARGRAFKCPAGLWEREKN